MLLLYSTNALKLLISSSSYKANQYNVYKCPNVQMEITLTSIHICTEDLHKQSHDLSEKLTKSNIYQSDWKPNSLFNAPVLSFLKELFHMNFLCVIKSTENINVS